MVEAQNTAMISSVRQVNERINNLSIPTKVSELENDKGYLTEHQSLENYITEENFTNGLDAQNTATNALIRQVNERIDGITVPTKVSAFENDAGYLTEHQSLAEYAKKTEIPAPYTLPVATKTTLGGVKVDGNTITIADGVISAKGGSGGGTADVFTGAGEDTITTEKTFEDSSFSFNKAKFLDTKGVKEKGYGYYKLSSEGQTSWLNGKAYYSINGTDNWQELSGIAIQGGSTPYGCSFSNSSFYVSGVENTIIITYAKGETGTSGLVPAPTDNGKVLGSNGEWISVNMVSTIKTGIGTNSEKFNDNNNTASGDYSHAEGQSTQASGTAAHTEGRFTQASGWGSHAEGIKTFTMGTGSHAEGYSSDGGISSYRAQGSGSHIEGYSQGTVINYGDGAHIEGYADNQVTRNCWGKGAHIEGCNSTTNNGTDAAHVEGYYTIADAAYHHIEGKYNLQDGDAMYQHIAGNGTSSNRSNSHTLDWQGNAVFAGTVSNSGADYAEYFEWLDENDNVDDRVGYIVTLEGNKIRFANSEDDVLGIVSGTATVLGDNAEWEWQGKYLKDEFGRKIIDWVEHKSTTTIYNDDGTSEKKEISLGFFPEPRINPAFNENEEYVNRYWRPEWDAVGLMGKLFVRDNGSCQVGGYVKPDNGIAIPSAEKTNMRVLKRVNDNVIQVLLK